MPITKSQINVQTSHRNFREVSTTKISNVKSGFEKVLTTTPETETVSEPAYVVSSLTVFDIVPAIILCSFHLQLS